jgi:ankyrin repeat protein
MSEDILEKQLFEIIRNKDSSEDIKLAKIDMLIRLGVDVNAMYGARSVLNLAKYKKEEKVAKFLEENGAVDQFDFSQSTTLGEKLVGECMKVNAKFENVEELLDKGADIDYGNVKMDFTPLMWSCCRGHQDIVKLLLDNDASLKYFCENGETSLMKAVVEAGNMEIVKMLIDKGANVNDKDNTGLTPLMRASRNDNKEIVEMLLSNGADLNARDNENNTALFWAVNWKAEDVTEYLVSKGADFNQKNNYGRTALMLASMRGYKEFVELLIQSGADIGAKNSDGEKAIDLAKDDETRDVIKKAYKNRFFAKVKRGLGMGE